MPLQLKSYILYILEVLKYTLYNIMALPIPSAPIVIPSMLTDNGNAMLDSKTKSSIEKAVSFVKLDACDQHTLTKFRTSIVVNARTATCDLVNTGQLTLSGAIPPNGTIADFDVMIAELRTQLLTVLDPA
jgi:hypothetical protein